MSWDWNFVGLVVLCAVVSLGIVFLFNDVDSVLFVTFMIKFVGLGVLFSINHNLYRLREVKE